MHLDQFLARWEWAPATQHTRALSLQVESIKAGTSVNGFVPPAGLEKSNPTLTVLASAVRSSGNGKAWAKLILPATSGYVLRTDFLRWRLVACEQVASAQSLAKPGQYLEALQDDQVDISKALTSAAGIIIADSSSADADFDTVMSSLDVELANRLNYPWVVEPALTKNRLVIVSHRHPDVMANYLRSCAAAGIAVTLVDAPGGFVCEEKRFGAVEECVEIDMTRNDGLTGRIVEALATRGPFDGMVTFTDTYMLQTAEAATKMGLYTLPLDLVKTCLDKHATRKFFKDAKPAMRVNGKDVLREKMQAAQEKLEYPLIIKPCTAWGSQGVYKAATEEELFAAVDSAIKSATTADLIVDEYCDGPEVDANFVLQDGKVLYFEMVDGFPCTAEVENGGKAGDFIETDQMWPSKHPQVEQDLARTKLHELLLRMGITDGVFHVEGRFRNAALRYQIQDGILDLYEPKAKPSEDASLFLLEVNQRPPGHGGSWGTAMSYGIDYPLLHMFCALRQPERYAAAAHPFARGAVQFVDSVFVNSDTSGTYVGGNMMEELTATRPDLAKYVQYSNTYYDQGEAIADSPARIALFVIATKESRRKTLEISKELRAAIEVKVDAAKQ